MTRATQKHAKRNIGKGSIGVLSQVLHSKWFTCSTLTAGSCPQAKEHHRRTASWGLLAGCHVVRPRFGRRDLGLERSNRRRIQRLLFLASLLECASGVNFILRENILQRIGLVTTVFAPSSLGVCLLHGLL